MSDSATYGISLAIEQLRHTGFGDDMTFSIAFSRITREARRVYGVAGAQSLLKPYLKPTQPMADDEDDIDVQVPSAHFRVGPLETVASDLIRAVIDGVRQKFGDEAGFRVILTRAIREAEWVYGDAATQQLLKGLIDTMPEAAQYDRS